MNRRSFIQRHLRKIGAFVGVTAAASAIAIGVQELAESIGADERKLDASIRTTEGLSEPSGNVHFSVRFHNLGDLPENNISASLEFHGPVTMQVNEPNDRKVDAPGIAAKVSPPTRDEATGTNFYTVDVIAIPEGRYAEALFVSNDIPTSINLVGHSSEGTPAFEDWSPLDG